MLSVMQKWFVVLLLTALLAPAAVTTCVAYQPCEGTGAATHECCDEPTLGACECADTHQQGSRPSEPAQRAATVSPELATTTPADGLLTVSEPSARDLSDPRPPLDAGARLSLLATLVV